MLGFPVNVRRSADPAMSVVATKIDQLNRIHIVTSHVPNMFM